jgi:murein L,D-transpeptidase YcbB/YkuD
MMEKGFRVFSVSDGHQVEIAPTAIDWKAVNPAHIPYVIRQDAGDSSALGRIKFIIPNTDDIYLHDTPERGLFRRSDRALSSGCIRLEKPLDLVAIVLEGTPGWDKARALKTLDSQKTSSVTVGRSLPVRLHYTTIVVEGTEIRVRPDIYGLDEAYARALDAPRTPRMAALTGDR